MADAIITAYLKPIPVEQIAGPLDWILTDKIKLETLLEIVIEAAESIDDSISLDGKCEISLGVIKARAERIQQLGYMMTDALKDIHARVEEGDSLIGRNLQYRAAH